MPQQAQRDTDLVIAVAVGRLGEASGAQLRAQTRTVTTDLLRRLPGADRLYLEQMMYATYCSTLRDNAGLSEADRNARIQAYNRELRAALYVNPKPTVKVDPRDAARAELQRIPLEYSTDSFIKSAELGKREVVRLFLQAGIDPNAVGRGGITALMHAAGRGDLAIMEMLLKARADVNLRTYRDRGTALSWAAAAGQVDAMRRLLKAGASGDSLFPALLASIRGSHVHAVRLMLSQGANPRTDDGETAIRFALSRSNRAQLDEILNLLLQRGWPVDARLPDGQTALMVAALEDNLPVIESLLRNGARVDLQCECRAVLGGGHTALTLASFGASMQAVRLLLDAGASVDTASGYGTALMLALGKQDVAKLLLSRGADPNKARDRDNESALMWAAFRNTEMVRILIDAGANVNAQSISGATALMRAAEADRTDAAHMLLEAGAKLDASTKRGRTALIIAAMSGSVDTARLLVQRGARTDAFDEDNLSALAHASARLQGDERMRMLAILGQKEAK